MIKYIYNTATRLSRKSNETITKYKKPIEIILILAVVLLIILDIIWAFYWEETISSVIRDYVLLEGFWFTWVWGVLFSHLFLTRKLNKPPIREGLALSIIILMTIGFAILGYQLKSEEFKSILVQVTLLLMGGVAGYILWPQLFQKQD